ncbi:hypothetical protein [Paractinoplanes maris]|uniref:hypothetical protein n=1 Tax=Paractinoplanes maris TaxID=1734446 RepID=UPI002021D5C9|nr:hypothetical protein [Actinoplanes maris]
MTAAALVVLAWFALASARQVARLRHAHALVRQVACERGAELSVDRAARLGLVNPAPRRRWSSDRQDTDRVPVPRVLHDMPHH